MIVKNIFLLVYNTDATLIYIFIVNLFLNLRHFTSCSSSVFNILLLIHTILNVAKQTLTLVILNNFESNNAVKN